MKAEELKMAGAYKPVPVEVAEAISRTYEKAIVIILSYDTVYELLHTTTYGKTAEEKAQAVAGGEIASQALGAFEKNAITFQDYRLEQAIKLFRALKAALKIVQEALEKMQLSPRDAIKQRRLLSLLANPDINTPGLEISGMNLTCDEREGIIKILETLKEAEKFFPHSETVQ